MAKMRSVQVDIIRKCKKPMHFENCSAFGGSSTSGTLTSTDSNVSNKDIRSGTLTSTDSNNSVSRNNNISLNSAHLDVFGFSPNRALELPVYPEKQASLSRSTSGSDLRQITVLERLTKTHPIWFLPQVGRSGAVHLLKNRETGIFIVRKSSRDDIMALSVQYPNQDGTQNVDHYLIEPSEHGTLHLQGSMRLFNAVPNLIAHYCDNKEDLPHRLVLPPAVRHAKTSQELTALAMLGQDFWTSSKYDAPSRSSSRSNLSEHSATMNKSQSEPISIIKNPVPAYSQSDALIQQHTPPISQSDEGLPQNTPPKHSVIDFSSYLIQKPSKTLLEIGQTCSQQSLSSISESVHSKCSLTGSKSTQSFNFRSESKQTDHVTKKRHVTRSTSLHEDNLPKQRLVLQVNDKENRVDIKIAKRESLVSVPYAKPNKVSNETGQELDSGVPVDYLHVPEEYYFRSNLSDKLSDYEDIWKNNYADPKVGSVQADIVQRLQPNLVNGNSPRSPTSPVMTTTVFHEQYFSEKCLTTDLNVSLDKLTLSNVQATTKNISARDLRPVSSQVTDSATTKVSETEVLKHQCIVKGQIDQNVQSANTTGDKSPESEHIDQIIASAGFDSILEQDSDIDCDSDHGRSYHSNSDADADTEDPEAEPINSVQTQTSPSWKLNSPPFNKSARKSVSTSSLAMKSPVYSEPFDAISPVENENKEIDQAPKLPKKLRRRSAPALSHVSKRCHPSTECSKLSPLVYEPDKTVKEESPENSSENSNDEEDVFEMSLELRKDNQNEKTEVDKKNENAYEKAWVDRVSADGKNSEHIENNVNKPKPNPRKTKVKKQNLLQEAITNQRNKKEDSIRNSQNEYSHYDMNIIDQFKFLDDLDENQNPSSPTVGKFPVFTKVGEDQKVMYSEGSTAEDIISKWNPELTLRPLKPFPTVGPLSEYDNLNNPYVAPSVNSTGTLFCNPWENSVIGKIMKTQSSHHPSHIPVTTPPPGHAPPPPLPSLDPRERIEAWRKSSQKYHSVQIETEDENRLSMISDNNSIAAVTFGGDKNSSCNLRVSSNEQSHSQSDKTIVNEKSTTHSGTVTERYCENIPLFGADFRDKVAPVLTQPRIVNKSDRNRNPDRAIRDYIISLSNDRTTTFGSTIENFIQCTLESPDTNPHNITRNVRQFMTGIKNYLVKHGEGELEDLIERERNQLGKDEILNIDAIIEGSLHVCVIQPLKQNIYKLFVNEYTRNGNLKLLSNNIKYARTKTAEEIGIRKGISPPDGQTLEMIKQYFTRMQKSYSPLKKLEHLLAATSSIYKCVAGGQRSNSSLPLFGADDFLPMLIYVLVHCGMVSVEIEADYMWGLLHPSLLNGEGGYYLTSLSSAVLVLKNFQEMQETTASQQEGKLPSISDMQGFLKIAIPDEQQDTIVWRTLPVRPSMTTRDVCSMIAHKFKITNPQDYGLCTLENGEEHKLMDMECPQSLKADRLSHKKECIFAYKRNAANIAWPKSVQ